MKRIMSILLFIVWAIALAGCSGNSASNTPTSKPPVSTQEPSSTPSETDPSEETPQQTTLASPSALSSTPSESGPQEKMPQPITPTPSPSSSSDPTEGNPQKQPEEGDAMPTVNIQVGDKNFTATLYDNDSTRALLEKMPLILNMDELNGNEKFYFFSEKLPVGSERVGNIQAGDLMLYGADCLVLFYESFSTSYSYTRLGYIEDVSGLENALGNGSVEVIFRAGD